MQFLPDHLDNLPTIFDIQPITRWDPIVDIWIVLSIILLIGIAYALTRINFNFMETMLSFLFSESQTYARFKLLDGSTNAVSIFFSLFFALQVTTLLWLIGYSPLGYILKLSNSALDIAFTFLIDFCIIVLFFLGKAILFQTIKFLLPSRVDVNYLNYSYNQHCYYSSCILMLLNLFGFTYKLFNVYFLGVLFLIGFYLFFIVRSISISSRYNILGSIYFFLYLCTLEIIPILLLVKAL